MGELVNKTFPSLNVKALVSAFNLCNCENFAEGLLRALLQAVLAAECGGRAPEAGPGRVHLLRRQGAGGAPPGLLPPLPGRGVGGGRRGDQAEEAAAHRVQAARGAQETQGRAGGKVDTTNIYSIATVITRALSRSRTQDRKLWMDRFSVLSFYLI